MKFLTIRDFRNQASSIRKAIRDEHEIVLTANGRPFAVLADVDEDTFEEKIAALRRARGLGVLERIGAHARETGADQLTMREIDAEIARARRQKRSKR